MSAPPPTAAAPPAAARPPAPPPVVAAAPPVAAAAPPASPVPPAGPAPPPMAAAAPAAGPSPPASPAPPIAAAAPVPQAAQPVPDTPPSHAQVAPTTPPPMQESSVPLAEAEEEEEDTLMMEEPPSQLHSPSYYETKVRRQSVHQTSAPAFRIPLPSGVPAALPHSSDDSSSSEEESKADPSASRGNDPEELELEESSEEAYRKLILEGVAKLKRSRKIDIRLQDTWRVITRPVENRYRDNYVPPLTIEDELARHSLTNFKKPHKCIQREVRVYEQLQPELIRLAEYEIDREISGSATGGGGGGAPGGGSGGGSESLNAAQKQLQSLFVTPDGATAPPPLAAAAGTPRNSAGKDSSSSPSSASASPAPPAAEASLSADLPPTAVSAASPTPPPPLTGAASGKLPSTGTGTLGRHRSLASSSFLFDSHHSSFGSPASPVSAGSKASAAGNGTDPAGSEIPGQGGAVVGGIGLGEEGKLREIPDEDLESILTRFELYKNITLADARRMVDLEAKTNPKQNLFWRYQPDFRYGLSREQELRPNPNWMWQRDLGDLVLISVKQLKFSLGSVEPLFCSLTLYDLDSKRRISESFHFDLNPKEVLTTHLRGLSEQSQPLTRSQHCIFSIPRRTEKIVLVLQVERVLRGDGGKSMDEYLSQKPKSQQDVAKFAKQVRETAEHLSEYRQPFAWGFTPLFDRSGDLLEQRGRPVHHLRINHLYAQPESLKPSQLLQYMLTDQVKKLKVFPRAFFGFRIDICQKDRLPRNRIGPSAIELQDTPTPLELPHISDEQKAIDPQPVVRELQSLDVPQELKPHTHFHNLFYVYPEMIAFQKYRNIVCQVTVKTLDDDIHNSENLLNVIPGRSSCPAFSNTYFTQVNYHKRNPTPQDEVKLMLPLELTSKTHLLFTFYQVSCKKKGKQQAGARTVIGYSVLALTTPHGAFIPNRTYDLPIAQELPRFYISPFLKEGMIHFVDGNSGGSSSGFGGSGSADGQESANHIFGVTASKTQAGKGMIKWRDGGAPSFRVRVHLVSSVLNQDPSLATFFKVFPNEKELRRAGGQSRLLLEEALQGMREVGVAASVQFLAPVLDHIVGLLSKRSSPIARQVAFLAMTHLISKVANSRDTGSGQYLVAYITHRMDDLSYEVVKFKNDQPVPGSCYDNKVGLPVFNNLAHAWLTALQDNKTTLEMRKRLVKYSWFYFEVMFKSMCLFRAALNAPFPEPHHDEFVTVFKQLCDCFAEEVRQWERTGIQNIQVLMQHLALFFNDLYSVMDRKTVNYLVLHFLNQLLQVGNNTQLEVIMIKFPLFLGTFLDSEWFRQLWDLSPIPIKEGSDIIQLVRQRYRVTALLCESWAECLEHVSRAADYRYEFDALRDLLTKFDYDANAQNHLSSLALMFLPLLPALMKQNNVLRKLPSGMRRTALVSVLWVLKNVDPTYLHSWWSSLDPEELAKFLKLLELALQSFPWIGKRYRLAQLKRTGAYDPDDSPFLLAPESLPPEAFSLLMEGFGMGPAGSSGSYGARARLQQSMEQMNRTRRRRGTLPSLGGSEGVPLATTTAAAAAAGDGGEDLNSPVSAMAAGQDDHGMNGEPQQRLYRQPYHVHRGDRDHLTVGDLKARIEASVRSSTMGGRKSMARRRSLGLDPLGDDPLIRSRSLDLDQSGMPTGSLGMDGDVDDPEMNGFSRGRSNSLSRPHHRNLSGVVGSPNSAAAAAAAAAHALEERSNAAASGKRNYASTGGGTLRERRLQTKMLRANRGAGEKGSAFTLTERDADRVVEHEAELANEVSRIVMQTVMALFDWMQPTVQTKYSVSLRRPIKEITSTLSAHARFTTNLTSLMFHLMHSEQTHAVLDCLFPLCRVFVLWFSMTLYKTTCKPSEECTAVDREMKELLMRLTYAVFRLCSFSRSKVRQQAVSILYLMLRKNFDAAASLDHSQVSFTMALTRFIKERQKQKEGLEQGGMRAEQELAFRQAFSSLREYAGQDTDVKYVAQFSEELGVLLDRLNTVLADSMEISRQRILSRQGRADPTVIEHLLKQVADKVSHIPSLHTEWLEQLADHHVEGRPSPALKVPLMNWAEAAQVELLIAKIILENDLGDSDEAAHDEERDTESVVRNKYHKTCEYLERAHLWEQAYEIYKLLIPIYERRKNYAKLSDVFGRLKSNFDDLISYNDKQQRMLGTYYRVGFYGKDFGPRFDNTEWVYKMPKITQLNEIAHQLRSCYRELLGKDVKVLPDSRPVRPEQLNPEEPTLQITFLQPWFPEEELPQRQTFIERNTNLKSFTFSSPFTKSKDGKAYSADLREQWKLVTVIHVEYPFPFLKTVQRVVNREETELSPIQAATDDLRSRIESMNRLLDSPHLEEKTLTGLLSGTVLAQVNGGAMKLVEAFLPQCLQASKTSAPVATVPGTPSQSRQGSPTSAAAAAAFPGSPLTKEQEGLLEALEGFFACIHRALETNGRLFCKTESAMEFHQVIRQDYEKMRQELHFIQSR